MACTPLCERGVQARFESFGRNRGRHRYGVITNAMGLSPIKVFREQVGLTPKVFC